LIMGLDNRLSNEWQGFHAYAGTLHNVAIAKSGRWISVTHETAHLPFFPGISVLCDGVRANI
jgi:hypothetical protein